MQLPPRETFIDEYLEGYMFFHAEEFEEMEVEEAEAAIKQVQIFAGARWDHYNTLKTGYRDSKFTDEQIEIYVDSLEADNEQK